ncbi:hypothetical protein CO046_00620 [Candidatus Peregrinibacteria bacterium CG_4_9_14_0_2_um_filter_53_11]|nr:MAG: hypothetical protein CO046_00620 [Candidatus Peregrinibacteria bacterium CG_4_9_14_0_2_um_filter_53_11]
MNFVDEFRKLFERQPHNALVMRASEDSHFSDYLTNTKNAYLSWMLHDADNCAYSDFLIQCTGCVDCAFLANSELCYECVDCTGLYSCSYLQDCHNCTEVHHSVDCLNCRNCFGCVGLRQREFCIFNKQYSEEEYRMKVAALRKKSPAELLCVFNEEFKSSPRLYRHGFKTHDDSSGDYLNKSSAAHQSFNISSTIGALYSCDIWATGGEASTVIDCDMSSNLTNCYQCHNTHRSSDCLFLEGSTGCIDSEYLIDCLNCQNCFGCVYLKDKQYCLLNRQLTRDEYLHLLPQVKAALREAGYYGRPLADILGGSTIMAHE